MTYVIDYPDGALEAFSKLDSAGRDRTVNKLYEVATDDYRDPWNFDYKRVRDCIADGRLRVSDDIRVFVDIDRKMSVLRVWDVDRRENLY